MIFVQLALFVLSKHAFKITFIIQSLGKRLGDPVDVGVLSRFKAVSTVSCLDRYVLRIVTENGFLGYDHLLFLLIV